MPNPPSGNHEHELLELAYPYALDAVSDSERASITERLGAADAATSGDFARIIREIQETMALITAADTLTPPPQLKTLIMAVLDAHTHTGNDVAARSARRRRRLTRAVAVAAAVAIIGLGAAIATGQFPRHIPPPAGLSVAQVLHAPDIRTRTAEVAGGTISIAASAQTNAAVVTMTDVPPPPAGHVYQMWLMPASGPPRSAGTMTAATMPPPRGEVVHPLYAAATVAITVEPGAGSTQPTGQRVVTIPLT